MCATRPVRALIPRAAERRRPGVLAALVCAFSALSMTGVIWFVQIVHYPLFASVGGDRWTTYHAGHTRRTGWVVAPLMVAELGSAAVLVLQDPGALAIVGGILAAATWAFTLRPGGARSPAA